jgi:putative ABC transport system permease protein
MKKQPTPPRIAQQILKKTICREISYSALGDFDEIYFSLAEEQGLFKANLWYWGQMLKSLPSFIIDSLFWSFFMILNYFKIAFRNMRKQKLDTFLNITGLSLGIACTLLILFHIKDELSYDRFFPKAERIYRVVGEMREGDNVRQWATTDPEIAERMTQHFPEIENTCRMFPIPSLVISYQPENDLVRRFKEPFGFFADQSSIDIFNFKFIRGNPETALSEVNSIVLTETVAKKFFSEEKPVGKFLLIRGDGEEKPTKVTGVIEDLPSNSHMQFKYLLSYPTFIEFLRSIGKEEMATARGWAALYNYVLLHNSDLIQDVESRLPDFIADHFAGMGPREEILSNISLKFQPIVDIHLYSKLEQEIKANSDVANIYIFFAIALFIMIIAGVNFVNISTAQALKRLREIGVRKVLGARKPQLIKQIFGESFLLIFISTFIALLLLETFLPFYNELTGKDYSFSDVFVTANASFFIGIVFLFGIIASLYPALFVSGFNPVQSIKGLRDPYSAAVKTRKGLVIFQFAISVFMIFSTIITYKQMVYFKNTRLGFDKENLLVIQLNNDLQQMAIKNPGTLKNELYENPSVIKASVVSNLPGDRLSVEHLYVDGAPSRDERSQFRFIRVDSDYLQVLKLKLTNGRDFFEASANASAFIINEKAARELKLKNPLGHTAKTVFGNRGEIVGIVKDFHFASLHNRVEPLTMELFPREHQMISVFCNYLIVRIKGENISETLNYLKTKIKKIAPASLFNYSFLDQDLNRLYDSENRMSNMFKAFAIFALLISCLGLFGLSSYSAQLRVKEIGVRKVLGASILNIVNLLSKNFMIWILMANLIALPIGWIFMSNWLNNFANRIELGVMTFILTIIITICVAILTVSYQSVKMATADPVDSLRYE